jgi:protein SCO1/2
MRFKLLIARTIAIATLVLALSACSGNSTMFGTILTGKTAAPDFQLTNQFNQSVSSSDYFGNVVVVTFLYTDCSDICPILVNHLKDIRQELAGDADKVEFVVISVDPLHDDVASAYAFSDRWDMLEKWEFLVGEQEQLAKVWENYFIDPSVEKAGYGTTTKIDQVPGSNQASVDAFLKTATEPYAISHSAPIYLIGKDGLMRVLFTLPIDPLKVVHDIQKLLY